MCSLKLSETTASENKSEISALQIKDPGLILYNQLRKTSGKTVQAEFHTEVQNCVWSSDWVTASKACICFRGCLVSGRGR